jgi:hypothetical protein
MKFVKLFSVAMAVLAIASVTCHAQLSLNYASTPGASIQFNGANSTFQFNSSTITGYVGSQWSIGSQTGGTGSALGLFGVVTNSPFTYGLISSTILGPYTIQTANVTGPLGGLNINDGVGNLLTGDVNWVQLVTINSIGGINASLTVNVTSLSYSGTNPDLVTFASEPPGTMNVSFQFSPGKMLSELTSGTGPYTTSFSGSLTVVPEPTTISCLLLGFGALACGQRFTKNSRSS